MSDIVKFNSVEEFIIELRGQKVILDSNVATLYGVETQSLSPACTGCTVHQAGT